MVQSSTGDVGYWTQLALLLAAVALAFLYWHLVSRRREAEAILQGQIRERDSRLNLALWGSGDEFWDWNVREKSLYRLGAARLLGQGSLETMSTDDWRNNSIHPEDWPRVQKLLEEHISGQTEIFESEHRVRGSDGGWVWVRSRGKVVERDTAGNPLRMITTEPGPKSLAEAASGPVYQTPLMITFLISLL